MEGAVQPDERILDEIRCGGMVIVCDDEDRENEGDLTMAAEKVTPEAINFTGRYGRGLICLPLDSGIIDRLGIPDSARHNQPLMKTAFMASVDADRPDGRRLFRRPRPDGRGVRRPGERAE